MKSFPKIKDLRKYFQPADIDYLSSLPIDVILQQLTYLPFDDVTSLCTSNKKLHYYCSDPKYNNKWKQIIDNTFNNIYNYQDKLNKIWTKLNLVEGSYNYLVYTQLIKFLDPITQLMIYYKQGDMKSFNDQKFEDYQRFLAMFLLNKPEEMRKYFIGYKQDYFELLNGKIPPNDVLNYMLIEIAENGNVRGVKYLVEKGANIHADNDRALRLASQNGYLDVVRYLVEQGANIHAYDEYGLISASLAGHIDVVRYLVEQGANIHAVNDDDALIEASRKGHLDVVKYLIERGANIHAQHDWALIQASNNGHLDVVKYLVEHGADIHAQHNWALSLAIKNGHIDVVKYLVEQGTDIHTNDIKIARKYGHTDIVKYLQEKSRKRYFK